MSDCKQKFLGLDSIDVLLQYINTKVSEQTDSKVCTIQVFKYVQNGELPGTPSVNIYYDFAHKSLSFPTDNNGWGTLNTVLANLTDEELINGSIYTSVRLQIDQLGADHSAETNWSRPTRISGVNGTGGAEFKFSYTIDGDYSSDVLEILDEDGKREIYYKYRASSDSEWSDPMIWAVYTTNGTNGNHGRQVLYRYCATAKDENGEMIVPVAPTSSNDSNWSNTLLNITLSEENPYLWMSTATVIAGETIEESEANGVFAGWSDPVLFSKLGLDGNVPDYNVTLYAKGAEEDGLIQPDMPIVGEFDEETGEYIEFFTLDVVKETNPEWVDVPADETQYWWMCTLKVRGFDNKVLEVGSLKRYNGVDGEAQPGEWTEMCFMWSETQQRPALEIIEGAIYPTEWDPQYPNQQPSVGANLWMTVGKFKGMNEDGTPKLIVPWSDPVCISGPVCPVSIDSRFEIRYTNGNASAVNPQGIWVDDPANVRTTNTYPYIWGKQYLVYYQVNYEYGVDEEGNFTISETTANVVPDGVTQEYAPYRISGLNGNNGNTKNNIEYKTDATAEVINNFIDTNMYIYNGSEAITYEIDYNQIDFESGYTCKFANVGTSTVTIIAKDPYCFIGSGKTSTDKIQSITISSQESIELVCYKTESEKSFIVIGKEI